MDHSSKLALQSLVAVSRRHGRITNIDAITHEFGTDAYTPERLLQAAKHVGLIAGLETLSSTALIQLNKVFPAIVFLTDGESAIIAGIVDKEADPRVALLNPANGQIEEHRIENFVASWTGQILIVKNPGADKAEKEPFGFSWFIPQILKQRDAFKQIGLATLALGFVSLGTPIFVQQVIDKVLVHQNMSTLYVLTIGVMLAIFFEAIFTYLRTYIQNAATRKIDLQLSREGFHHLTGLPIDYFEKRQAGMVVRQLQQVQQIRNFLTGSIFFTALECVMFFIFLPILMLYSFKLTMVVLVIAILMALMTWSLIGPFKRRLEKTAGLESKRQGMLTETVHGIRTVKALTLESRQNKEWEETTAKVMDLVFNVLQITNLAQAVTVVLQRVMIVGIIVIGSFLVINQEITLGVLIGFQMLSGRVTSPISMLVSLIHEYQEVAVSINMLGDIMNSPREKAGQVGLRPPVKGEIVFDTVGFRYPGTTNRTLENFSLEIKEGEMLGMVGKSGSGKSTVAKLLQGLYYAQEGLLRIDGVDVREYDLVYLRKQVGIVLQDSFLFKGTIRDNIAAGRQGATLEEVVLASKASGADEFISTLPQGYDSPIEEGSTNLSGGQRQRIAIARTLIARPKVLIFDEATSALDPETEAIVMGSLSTIAKGRTVILISHRLATLTTCNRIAFLQQGKLLACEPHNRLLEVCEPYNHLWKQQASYSLT